MPNHQPIIDYFQAMGLTVQDEDVEDIFVVIDKYRESLSVKGDVIFSKIVAAVSRHTDVDVQYMQSRSRRRELVMSRHLVCYFSRKYTNKTYMFLANYFNQHDHTSAMNSIRKVTELLSVKDTEMVYSVNEIETILSIHPPVIGTKPAPVTDRAGQIL